MASSSMWGRLEIWIRGARPRKGSSDRTCGRLSIGLLLASSLALAAAEAPPFALTDDAVPRRYSIELTVDPDRDSFQGVARIDVELRKRLPVIWLNATNLTISEADLQVNGRSVPVHSTLAGGEFLGIEPETPVGPGRALLTLHYSAPLV